MPRNLERTYGDFDAATMGEAFARPGMDTRQWVSYGTVDERTTDQTTGETTEPVEFDPDYGPLISVTLQPSGIPCRCRVAAQIAGNGEGSYHPFIPGDEVIVAIPQGDERAGACIFGRLNNAIDAFPMESVAGQDPTKNAFGFTRRRTPYVEEFASTWMVRVASHGGFVLISETGAITVRDGFSNCLQMGPDAFSYQDKAGANMLQVDITSGRFTAMVKDAIFTLSSSSASPGTSAIGVPGTFALSSLTNPAAEHAMSTEATVSYLLTLLTQIAAGFTLIPPAPPFPGGAPFAAVLTALIASGLASVTSAAGVLTPAAGSAIMAKFAAAPQKPPGTPTSGQLAPGIGSSGFFIG
jgi:hypothetical protein